MATRFPVNNAKRIVDIYELKSVAPQDRYKALTALSKISGLFKEDVLVVGINYKLQEENPQQNTPSTSSKGFEMTLNLEFKVADSQREFLEPKATALLESLKKALENYEVTYTKPPTLGAEDKTAIQPQIDAKPGQPSSGVKTVSADIKITLNGKQG